MKENNAITAKQMARFTFVAQTGVGIVTLPTLMAKDAGHDGWIPVIASGIVAILLSALIVVLLRRYANKSILDINKLIFGKIAGTALNCILFIYLICTTASGVRIFSLFLQLTLFPTTPPLVMTPLILIPSFYMIWQGLKIASRFKAVTMLAYAITLIFVLLILKELKLTFVLPVGEAGVLQILSGMKTSFFLYLGLELIAVFFAEITDKDNAMKWHVSASLFSMLFAVIIVAACIMAFGAEFLSHQTIPLFTLSRIYNAPILERVDLYMVAVWFLAMGCSIRAYMMASYYTINKILKVEKNKYVYTGFIVALILLSRIPKDINETFRALELLNYAGMGVITFIILCLVISMFKKNGVNSNGTQA